MGFANYMGERHPVSLTFVASDGDGIIPASAQAGDLCVVFDYVAVGTMATPSGFTQVANSSVDDIICRTSYKVLSSGDPGATIVGGSGTVVRKGVGVFRPDWPITNVIAGSVNQTAANNSDPPPQTVTASGVAGPLIVFGGHGGGSGSGSQMTASPSFDGTVDSTTGQVRLGWKIYNTNPANVTVTNSGAISDTGLHSFYLRVS